MGVKRNIVVLFGVSSVLAMACASDAALMVTGFESDAVGSTPAGWFKSSATTASAVSDLQAKTGDHSWRVVSPTSGAGTTGFSSGVDDRPAVSTFSFSFYISSDTNARFFHEQYDGPGSLAIQLEFRTDAFGVRTFTGTGAPRKVADGPALNTWNDVVLYVDYNTRTFDLTLNGTLIEADMAMGGTGVNVGTVEHRFSPAFNAPFTAAVFIDDVSLAIPEPASMGLVAAGALALLRRRR